jgi:ABC-type branched-subunit amino acid transport system substrate-binding protein
MFGPVSPPDPGAPNWFSLGTSRINQYRVLVDYLTKTLKKTKLGIIRQQDSVGNDAFTGASDQAKLDGAQIVSDVQTETQATDVSAQVLKLKDAQPEVVLLGVNTKQALSVMQQAQDLGWHPQFAGDAGTVGGSQIITVGGQSAEGLLISQFVCTDLCADSPQVQQVQADAKKFAPDVSPTSNFLYENYGTVMVFAEIIKRMGNDLSWSNFTKQAETLKEFKTGLYPPVTFTSGPSGHVGTSGAYLVQVKEQKFSKLTDFLEPVNG